MGLRRCALLLLLVGALAGCASTATRPGAGGAAPRSHVHADGLPLVGVDGAAAWQLAWHELSLTTDGGRHWSTVPLPRHAHPGSMLAVAAAPGRGIWLGRPRHDAFVLYRRAPGSAGWTRTRLVPVVPAGLRLIGPPSGAIALGPGRLVAVTVGRALGTGGEYDRIFISTDDGHTFRQHPAPGGMHLSSLTFLDDRHALAVAGSTGTDRFVYRTADGGATWDALRLPVHARFEVGAPVPDGRTVLLPVVLDGGRRGDQVVVLRSTDAGATFTRPAAPLDVLAADSTGGLSVAGSGRTLWAMGTSRIYESTDAGAHWTTVPTYGAVGPIGLAGGTRAVGVLTGTAGRYLVLTTDGGRTWQPA